jgi:lipopolysaccharide transport system permease protein
METVIKPKSPFTLLDIQEIWRYKDLLYIFTWRDIKVRYKQTILGIAWVIFQPLITMAVFTFLFSKVISQPSKDLPYWLFVLIGIVFWTFFSSSISQSSNAFIENEKILKKVYFPRELLPLSTILTSLVDFLVNFLLLLLILIFYQHAFPFSLLLLFPVLTIILFLTCVGIGSYLSTLNIRYRDVRYLLPFFIQLFLFLSPVIYSFQKTSHVQHFLLSLNPLTGVIETARRSITGSTIDFTLLSLSFFIAFILFFAGLFYLRVNEQYFDDIL